jgi:hypothetical protein
MNSPLDFSGDPLSLVNIKTCAAASKLAYAQPTLVAPDSGESVLIQDCGNCTLIAFPGTHDWRDVLHDIDCLRVSAMILGRICSVHAGFNRTHRALMPKILAEAAPQLMKHRVFLTGHSKGAAVARRCALALIENNFPVAGLITFGEPRGGDARCSLLCHDALDGRNLRVTNAADPVPWLPAWLAGNRHCGPEAFLPARRDALITGPALLSKIWSDGWEIYQAWQLQNLAPLSDHHIDNYLHRLNAL